MITATTVIDVRVTPHHTGEVPYGMWIRLLKAAQLMPGALIPDTSTEHFFGVAGDYIVVALQTPERASRMWEVAKALPTAEWLPGNPPIRWTGAVSMRAEHRYSVRIYVNKVLLCNLPSIKEGFNTTGAIVNLEPCWAIFSAKIEAHAPAPAPAADTAPVVADAQPDPSK